MPRSAIAIIAAAAMTIGGPALADEVSGDQLVDALNGIFGKHPARGSHAKGQCLKGSFKPTPEAAAMSKAAIFAKEVPVLARFSFGGGDPNAKEKSKNPRGLAMRFDPDGDAPADFVQLSVPVFFARTPEQALGFLTVRAGAGEGKADADKIKAFAAANPETTRQDAAIEAGPIPASYATLNYWGIHAFIATSAGGEQTTIKFKSVPHDGVHGLSEEEAAAKPDDFITAGLKERLGKGPIGFDFNAIIGEKGDPTDNPTVEWPEAKRKSVKLGEVSISAIEDNAACDAGTFDPNNLPDGLAPAPDDQILPVRSTSYAASLSRRAQ